jgi:O-methyltransferase
MKPMALWNARGMPVVQIAKALTPPVIWQFLYRMLVIRNIPDAERYGMVYQPWKSPESVAQYNRVRNRTVVTPEGICTLVTLLRQALHVKGAIYEMGVYKGGSARLIRDLIEGQGRTMRLFDTFTGMKETDPNKDRIRPGDLGDTSLESVQALVGTADWIDYRQGWIPGTFDGIGGDTIAFAHIDVDLHDSIIDCCKFVYPRMVPGGVMLFDDYGFPATPGARAAIDAFFSDKPEVPLVLQTGQAVVTKLPG